MAPYIGRFAPSPTGPLHAGSLVAALASWLDARAHGGRWLVRIEDVDTPRCVAGADALILSQLAACGLLPDEAPVWQSQRGALYKSALQQLQQAGWAYPCGCTRLDIDRGLRLHGVDRPRGAERVYPGTCRTGLHGLAPRTVRALAASAPRPPWPPLSIDWHDRWLGQSRQDVSAEVGDFVLHRADGLWAYQLAAVVDDAAQGISHVVRGADLADNTPRQMHLQRLLGLATPVYLHTPLVLAADGQKLSKQKGAVPLDLRDPLAALRAAGRVLGIDASRSDPDGWWADATALWRARWMR